MRGDEAPLVVGELLDLVEHLERHARLPDVVEQRREPEIVQLELAEPESPAERDGEDADVHAVRERVLVVVADRRQADQRRLLVEDLVDDALHHALDLLDVRASAHADRVDDVLRHRHRLGVRPLRRFLRRSRKSPSSSTPDGGPTSTSVTPPACEAVHDVDEAVFRVARTTEPQRGQESSQSRGHDAGPHVRDADARRAEQRQDLREARVVVEVEPQPRLVDEDELARDAQLELAFARRGSPS